MRIAMLLATFLSVIAVALCDPDVRPPMECDVDADCAENLPHTECYDMRCSCVGEMHYYGLAPRGCYHPDERRQVLRDYKRHEIQEQLSCSVDADCDHLDDSVCVEGECLCNEPKSYFLQPVPGCYTPEEKEENMKKMLTKLKKGKERRSKGEIIVDPDNVLLSAQPPLTDCESNEDCSDYEHAVCVKASCVCQEGDKFRGHGEHIGCYGVNAPEALKRKKRTSDPIQSLDTACSGNEDCVVENSGCHDQGVCACYTGWYKDANNECSPISVGNDGNEEGTPCPTDGSDDQFCRRGVIKAICKEGKCACPSDFPIPADGVFGQPSCQNEETIARTRMFTERQGLLFGGRPGRKGGRSGGDTEGAPSLFGQGSLRQGFGANRLVAGLRGPVP